MKSSSASSSVGSSRALNKPLPLNLNPLSRSTARQSTGLPSPPHVRPSVSSAEASFAPIASLEASIADSRDQERWVHASEKLERWVELTRNHHRMTADNTNGTDRTLAEAANLSATPHRLRPTFRLALLGSSSRRQPTALNVEAKPQSDLSVVVDRMKDVLRK
jgi:hypothetical protein